MPSSRSEHEPPLRAPARIVAWPDWSGANPYQRLFYEALEPHGFEWVQGVPLRFDAVLDPRARIRLLHLHWPYAFWRSRGASKIRRWRALSRFALGLRAARARGVRVVWTVHDLEHPGGDEGFDRLGLRSVHRAAELVIHHTEWSREAARRRLGAAPGAELVMPHGSFDGALPEPAPRDAVRRELGLPVDRPVFVSVGRLDRYKGLDLLAAAAAAVGPDVHFVVAGEPGDLTAATLVDAGPRLTVLPERQTDQRLADLLEASDGIVLPYRRITTSGALIAALTAGRGVVASDLPPFREVLRPAPEAGVLVSPTAEGIARGVRDFLAVSPAARGRAARTLADSLEWAELVPPVARALDRLISAADRAPRA